MNLGEKRRRDLTMRLLKILALVVILIFVLTWCEDSVFSTPNHPHPTREMIDELKARCLYEGGEWTVQIAQSNWMSHDFHESYQCRFEAHDG